MFVGSPRPPGRPFDVIGAPGVTIGIETVLGAAFVDGVPLDEVKAEADGAALLVGVAVLEHEVPSRLTGAGALLRLRLAMATDESKKL